MQSHTTAQPPPGQHGADRAERWQQLLDAIQVLTRQMHALRDPGEWSEIELTLPQIRALDSLVSGPRRMSELAGALHTSMQATTSLIDRMVDKGLVERRHGDVDRRVVTCRLTELGQVEIERFYRFGQARIDLLSDVLSDAEVEQVTSTFLLLHEAVQRRLSPAAPPEAPE